MKMTAVSVNMRDYFAPIPQEKTARRKNHCTASGGSRFRSFHHRGLGEQGQEDTTFVF